MFGIPNMDIGGSARPVTIQAMVVVKTASKENAPVAYTQAECIVEAFQRLDVVREGVGIGGELIELGPNQRLDIARRAG